MSKPLQEGILIWWHTEQPRHQNTKHNEKRGKASVTRILTSVNSQEASNYIAALEVKIRCSKYLWDFSGGPWLRICLPMQGEWIQFLFGELRSHMPHHVAKKNFCLPLSTGNHFPMASLLDRAWNFRFTHSFPSPMRIYITFLSTAGICIWEFFVLLA